MGADNKKQEEAQATAALQTTTEQATQGVSPIDMYTSEISSLATEQEKLQEAYDARQAQIDERRKRMDEAKANRMSVFSAFVDEQKPEYDEKKEKRMRNRALIRAFGDVLSEASKGFFAYRKKGAGVVPKSTPSNALEEVNKISEMQKKYLAEKKAWDDLKMDWEDRKAQAEEAAAEALLAKDEKQQDALMDRMKENRERGRHLGDEMRKQGLKEWNDAKEMEAAKEYQLWLRDNKLGQYAPSKTTSSGGGGRKKSSTESEAARNLARWDRFGWNYSADTGEVVPFKIGDYTKTELAAVTAKWDDNNPVKVTYDLLMESMPPTNAIEAMDKLTAIQDYLIKNGDEDYDVFQRIVAEYEERLAHGGNLNFSAFVKEVIARMNGRI